MKSQYSNRWHTQYKKSSRDDYAINENNRLFHTWNDNDFYNGVLKFLNDEIDADAQQDPNLKKNCIILCSECKVPSNRYNKTASYFIRAHPNFRSKNLSNDQTNESKYPWHDWVDVEYHSGSACGRVLLWC